MHETANLPCHGRQLLAGRYHVTSSLEWLECASMFHTVRRVFFSSFPVSILLIDTSSGPKLWCRYMCRVKNRLLGHKFWNNSAKEIDLKFPESCNGTTPCATGKLWEKFTFSHYWTFLRLVPNFVWCGNLRQQNEDKKIPKNLCGVVRGQTKSNGSRIAGHNKNGIKNCDDRCGVYWH